MEKLIKGILVVVFLKELVFCLIIPVWHGPDEQAHFGQVAYFAEIGRMPQGEHTTTREILESEKLLGTLRDEQGNNKFTFHPEYKLDFSNSTIGIHENEINNVPSDFREELTIREASNYPPLFYILSAVPYFIFYSTDLITRIFLVRIVSIIFTVLTVYVAYLCGKLLFPKNSVLQVCLAVLISFQPMLSFLGATVNSDNLMNLLFSVVIYSGLKIVNDGLKMKTGILIVLVLIAGFLTKSQFVIAVPILLSGLLISVLNNKQNLLRIKNLNISDKNFKYLDKKRTLVILFFALLLILLPSWLIVEPIFRSVQTSNNFQYPIWEFFKGSLLQSYREALPWYWGVYDWLGVTYPRLIHRIINITLLISILGLILKIIRDFTRDRELILKIVFLIVSSVLYYLAITYFNYLYFLNTGGISVGIQGRYFFPTIISHLALILIGFITLFPKNLTEFASKALAVSMVALNIFALFTVINIYYYLGNAWEFFMQLSQYKPLFFKYPGNFVMILLYILTLGLFLYNFIRMQINAKDN